MKKIKILIVDNRRRKYTDITFISDETKSKPGLERTCNFRVLGLWEVELLIEMMEVFNPNIDIEIITRHPNNKKISREEFNELVKKQRRFEND